MNKFLAFLLVFTFGLILIAFNIQFDPGNTDSVSNYYFNQSITSYTPITSGTVIATGFQDDSTYGNIPIGFTFNYNGVNYSVVGISDNGWIQPGATSPPAHYTAPMICSTYVTPVICVFNADLQGNVTDTLRYLTTGTAPNRIFTIEWWHWGFHPYGNNEMNFELKLYENGNLIQFIYQPLSTSSTINLQVGLLGQSSSDYFTRTETSGWASTTAGTACSYCYYNSFNYPNSGLTFTFSPNPLGINPKTGDVPKEFKLYNNYPNPFNPSSTIRFDLPESAEVKLIVYNILGKEITTLVNGKYQAGEYSVTWDGTNYASGVYFYKLQTEYFSETKKMVLLK